MPDLLTVDETAKRLRVSRPKVYDLLRRGELSSFTIGRSRRIPSSSVDAYVESRLAAAGDAA